MGFMATTKSKSTSKTKKPLKAVKTPVTKSIKKTSSNNSSVKTTVTTKTTVKTGLSPLERIKSIHLSAALVSIIFAGLVIGFVTTKSVAVTLGVQARDQFAEGANVILAPASEVLFNIEPKYLLIVSLLVSALFSILVATKLRSRYEATITNRTSGFRWLALGLSAGLALSFISLLVGISDVEVLKLSGFLIVLTTMFSFMAERENSVAVRPQWFAYILSLITGTVAWLPVIASLIGTSLYSAERFGWHVYALVGVTLLGSIAFAVTQYRNIRSNRQLDYLSFEEKFLRIDMLTKFAVVVIVILALK